MVIYLGFTRKKTVSFPRLFETDNKRFISLLVSIFFLMTIMIIILFLTLILLYN